MKTESADDVLSVLAGSQRGEVWDGVARAVVPAFMQAMREHMVSANAAAARAAAAEIMGWMLASISKAETEEQVISLLELNLKFITETTFRLLGLPVSVEVDKGEEK